MITDFQIIESIKVLLSEKPKLFGKDARGLKKRLDSIPNNEPEAMRRAANDLLELLQRHAGAKAEFLERSGLDQDNQGITRAIYEVPPGGPAVVLAGAVMTCPGNCGYRRKLRQKGQVLFCSRCGCKLIPEKSNP